MHLDDLLASNDKTAVLFILSTEIATGRPHESIHEMGGERMDGPCTTKSVIPTSLVRKLN